jgi:streptomycin 6-kinase
MARSLYSEDFERFVARHFGARGRAWLDRLPARVEQYARDWQFEVEHHLVGGLLSCCLAVRLSDGTAAVLKLDGPWTPAEPEIRALGLWNGEAAPTLLRSDAVGGALLLERIEPGSMFEGGGTPTDATRVANLLRTLHAARPTSELATVFPSLAEIVEKLITTAGEEAEARSHAESVALQPVLERARRTAARLLDAWDGEAVLLHGDLENKNILVCRKRGLVAIDPLPSIGDPAYDAGYWASNAPPDEAREQRCTLLAEALDLERERVRLWASVAALDADV